MYLLFVRCLSNQSQHFVAYKALLMLRSRDPPEKLTVLQWLKKMPACYGTQCFLPQSMPVYHMYWQSTSILPSCLHLCLPVGLFSSLYLNPLCISVSPFPWPYVTCALPISSSFILLTLFCEEWAGYLSWYSDSLQAGWSGIESRRGRDFLPVQTGPWANPAPCKTSTGSFMGVKCGQGALLTTHPLLVLQSWKSRAIRLPTAWATLGL